jgi:hypothetical protein
MTVWLVGQHAETPHRDAVSYREFVQLQQTLREVKQDMRSMKNDLQQVREFVQDELREVRP